MPVGNNAQKIVALYSSLAEVVGAVVFLFFIKGNQDIRHIKGPLLGCLARHNGPFNYTLKVDSLDWIRADDDGNFLLEKDLNLAFR